MTETRTNPEHLAISKSKGIEIDWKDGHHSSYSVGYLRDVCPCATCTGAHGTVPEKTDYAGKVADPFPMFKPSIKMTSVEPVGNYAVRIFWNDGHSSGIYSFDHLRDVCPCEHCTENKG